ncbi:MAG: hypothetical protein ACRENB_06540 [Gemmatimonadales bacterium]
MNRPLLIAVTLAACTGGEPSAQAAAPHAGQSRFPVVCSLVTQAEVEKATGRKVVSMAPENPRYPTASCKIAFSAESHVYVRFGPLAPAVSSAEELTRDLNQSAMTGGQWIALPDLPAPAAALKDIPIVIVKKGELRLEGTGFAASYDHTRAIMAIAARRLP